jgi:hypothetical protein
VVSQLLGPMPEIDQDIDALAHSDKIQIAIDDYSSSVGLANNSLAEAHIFDDREKIGRHDLAELHALAAPFRTAQAATA